MQFEFHEPAKDVPTLPPRIDGRALYVNIAFNYDMNFLETEGTFSCGG